MSTGGEVNEFLGDGSFVHSLPVHRACRDGDVGALASLLQHFANRSHLNVEDSCYGWTPIHWATHFGQLECVVCLVQMGCEVNRTTSRFKQTPTHIAAFAGHSHCVEWFTLAGADIDKLDLLGEAPIHKAARSGSLDCMQALLLAGAKPNLRNNSGQTPADVAQAQGFHNCFDLIISKSLPHGPENGVMNRAHFGHGQHQHQHQHHGRKRLLNAMDTERMKKARRVERDGPEQVAISRDEEVESMSCEPTQDSDTGTDTANAVHRLHHTLPYESEPAVSPASLPANQHATSPPTCGRPTTDTCGSLHWTESNAGVHRPTNWEADCTDILLYGHYHGFGDTAEELSYQHRQELCSSSSSMQL